MTILLLDPILRAFTEFRFFLLRLQIALLAGMAVTLLIVLPVYGTTGAISTVVASSVIEVGVLSWKVSRGLHISWEDVKLASGVVKLSLAAGAAAAIAEIPHYLLRAQHPITVLAACAATLPDLRGVRVLVGRGEPRRGTHMAGGRPEDAERADTARGISVSGISGMGTGGPGRGGGIDAEEIDLGRGGAVPVSAEVQHAGGAGHAVRGGDGFHKPGEDGRVVRQVVNR